MLTSCCSCSFGKCVHVCLADIKPHTATYQVLTWEIKLKDIFIKKSICISLSIKKLVGDRRKSTSWVDDNKAIFSVDNIVVVGDVDGVADDAPENEDGEDGHDHVQGFAPFFDRLDDFKTRV